MHAPPESQLGLEVGVVAVAEGEVAGRQQADEDLDDVRVELAARATGAARRSPPATRDRLAVGVAGGDHVVGVGDGDQRAPKGISSPAERARVAAAVPALVVGVDDLGHRRVAVDPAHDPRRRPRGGA